MSAPLRSWWGERTTPDEPEAHLGSIFMHLPFWFSTPSSRGLVAPQITLSPDIVPVVPQDWPPRPPTRKEGCATCSAKWDLPLEVLLAVAEVVYPVGSVYSVRELRCVEVVGRGIKVYGLLGEGDLCNPTKYTKEVVLRAIRLHNAEHNYTRLRPSRAKPRDGVGPSMGAEDCPTHKEVGVCLACMEKSACPICMEKLDATATKLDCGHQFHKLCMLEWLGQEGGSKCCPCCREAVSE